MSRGLGDTQRAALTALADNDGTMTMAALADALGCTRSGAVKVVDGLRRAGLVWTTYAKHDTGRTYTQHYKRTGKTTIHPVLEGPYRAHVHLGDPPPPVFDTFTRRDGETGYRVTTTDRYGWKTRRAVDGGGEEWLGVRDSA